MDLIRHFPLSIDESAKGQRLDLCLAQKFPDISRSRWSKLIHKNYFQSAGKVLSAAHKVQAGERIDLESPTGDEEDLSFEENPGLSQTKTALRFAFPERSPEIIFEDDQILVLNKPVDLGVHPGHGLPMEETLVAWLIENKKIAAPDSPEYLKWGDDVLEEGRPGIVHRLDKGTSGLLVVAKNPKALGLLAAQFSSREAGRDYWAVVEGSIGRLTKERPPRLEGLLRQSPCPVALRIDDEGRHSLATFLERDPKHRVRYQVSGVNEQGKKAITHFHEIQNTKELSLVNLKLETGRTHQIRIHLSFLGFAILGDELYGGHPHSRLFLHAHALRLKHPTSGELMQFRAPLPPGDADWLRHKGFKL